MAGEKSKEDKAEPLIVRSKVVEVQETVLLCPHCGGAITPPAGLGGFFPMSREVGERSLPDEKLVNEVDDEVDELEAPTAPAAPKPVFFRRRHRAAKRGTPAYRRHLSEAMQRAWARKAAEGKKQEWIDHLVAGRFNHHGGRVQPVLEKLVVRGRRNSRRARVFELLEGGSKTLREISDAMGKSVHRLSSTLQHMTLLGLVERELGETEYGQRRYVYSLPSAAMPSQFRQKPAQESVREPVAGKRPRGRPPVVQAKILKALEGGSKNLRELASALGMPEYGLSSKLTHLAKTGAVERRKAKSGHTEQMVFVYSLPSGRGQALAPTAAAKPVLTPPLGEKIAAARELANKLKILVPLHALEGLARYPNWTSILYAAKEKGFYYLPGGEVHILARELKAKAAEPKGARLSDEDMEAFLAYCLERGEVSSHDLRKFLAGKGFTDEQVAALWRDKFVPDVQKIVDLFGIKAMVTVDFVNNIVRFKRRENELPRLERQGIPTKR